MTKSSLFRGVSVTAATMLGLFGFTSFAAAEAAMSNTGPGSYNKIQTSQQNSCRTTNKNTVKTTNTTAQHARTGSANVSHNTYAKQPPDWNKWNQSVRHTHGYGYEKWHKGLKEHEKKHADRWQQSWGKGASSGNASNSSSTSTHVGITNSNKACGGNHKNQGSGGGSGGHITTTGPHSTNIIRNHSSDYRSVVNTNTVRTTNKTHQNAYTGSANVARNMHAGSSSSGNATNHSNTSTAVHINNGGVGSGYGGSHYPAASTVGGRSASIYNTGPGSYNSVTSSYKSSNAVTNTNNVSTTNTTVQSASSGSAKVYGNTHAGSANSGNASNSSTTQTTVYINN